MSDAGFQLVILILAMLASGAIGYWVAREKHRIGPSNYGGHKPLPDTPKPRTRFPRPHIN